MSGGPSLGECPSQYLGIHEDRRFRRSDSSSQRPFGGRRHLGRAVGYLIEVKAGRGPWFAGIWVSVVPDFPGVTCFGVGVIWASGAGELAGNGVVAAPGRCVAVGTARGVSAGSGAGVAGLGADVAPSVVAGTVATAAPGAVCFPQASRAVRITRAIHRGNFNIREIISIAISEFRVPYG